MTSKDIIQVEMTEMDAKDFLTFQKYYINIKNMIDADIFSLKNGRAILDFDNNSTIQNIQKVLNYHFVIIKNL